MKFLTFTIFSALITQTLWFIQDMWGNQIRGPCPNIQTISISPNRIIEVQNLSFNEQIITFKSTTIKRQIESILIKESNERNYNRVTSPTRKDLRVRSKVLRPKSIKYGHAVKGATFTK